MNIEIKSFHLPIIQSPYWIQHKHIIINDINFLIEKSPFVA
jgi:hypothetical protein